MTSSYLFRLLCLSLASFFLIHTGVALLVRMTSGFALRVARTLRPRAAARLLFCLRVVPGLLSTIAVLTVCIPSYLWLEPVSSEEIGPICLLAAVFGLVLWMQSATRVAVACVRLWKYRRNLKPSTITAREGVCLLETEAPILALTGVLHPRVLMSRGVQQALSADQLEAALGHEHSHLISRDNLKRLMMKLAPDGLPFCSGYSRLEEQWSKYTEWAADDDAVGGDSARALSLAEAIVTVARMGTRVAPALVSTLVADGDDLSERVNRLLNPSTQSPEQSLGFAGSTALLLSACIALALLLPTHLPAVHNVLEHLVR